MVKINRKLDIVIPVYNGEEFIAKTIDKLLAQKPSEEYTYNIFVIDDSSTDKTVAMLEERYPGKICLLQTKSNSGRSKACNLGAMRGNGDDILFIDSDCVPTTNDFLAEHIKTLSSGVDISCGLIDCTTQSFWAVYKKKLLAKKLRSESANLALMFTTANIALSRSSFEKIGGFDEEYEHYGFEDRDLLIRLVEAKYKIRITNEAIVSHDDVPTLQSLCKKMFDAGRFTSILFAKKHPEEYRRMSYYWIDARYHKILRIFSFVLSGTVLPFLLKLEGLLYIKSIPFGLKSILVKIVSALAYLKGTTKA